MSFLDEDVIQALGVVSSGPRISIPSYAKVRVLPPGSLSFVEPLDVSQQSLASIILEIPDMTHLRRYFPEVDKQ